MTSGKWALFLSLFFRLQGSAYTAILPASKTSFILEDGESTVWDLEGIFPCAPEKGADMFYSMGSVPSVHEQSNLEKQSSPLPRAPHP